MNKYSFDSVCNSFRRMTQQPQQSSATSHKPPSQEGGTRLRNFKMTTPHAFSSTKQSAGGEGQKERGGSALRGHLLSVPIPFSKYRLYQLLRLGMSWWELFQLSNWSLEQSASGG